MRKRYEAALAFLPKLHLQPALALRQALNGGYGKRDLVADLMAGVVVGVVALESVLTDLQETRHLVILAGVKEQPAQVLDKAGRSTAEWSAHDLKSQGR